MHSTLFKILALLFIGYFFYLAYLDFRFREMKRRLVLILYPLVFYINFKVSSNLMLTVFGMIILFLTLYLVVLMKPNSFGAIDILMAPVVTIWFNEYALLYSLSLIIVNSLLWRFGIVDKLFKREGEVISSPFLVIMLSMFLVFLILVPSNFGIIFSLN